MNETDNRTRAERQKTFITNFCYWAIVVLIVFLLCKYALPVLTPFVVATIVACVLNGPISFLSRRLRIKKALICVPTVLLFYLIVGVLLAAAAMQILEGTKELVGLLPSFFTDVVTPLLESTAKKLDRLTAYMLPEKAEGFSVAERSLHRAVETGFKIVANALRETVAFGPTLLVQSIVTIVVTVFITIDFDKFRTFISRQIPDDKREIFSEARAFFGGVVFKCVGAYAAIIGLTFIELAIGLSLLQIPRAATLAALIAIVDILPILGTGTILIPWGIIALLHQNYVGGGGVLLLYIVITVVRNIVEPRLVGKQIGLHPVVVFAGMLLGLRYMGLLGMFGVPLFFAFIKNLNDKKLVRLFR